MNFKLFSRIYLIFLLGSFVALFYSDRHLRTDLNNAEQIPVTLFVFLVLALLAIFTATWFVALIIHLIRAKGYKK